MRGSGELRDDTDDSNQTVSIEAGAVQKTDVEAIQLALERGVTSKFPDNSGEGLFVTAEALKANGGDLLIRSGSGVVILGAHPIASLCPQRFPGTLVAFRARRDRPLDYHAVYSSSADG